MAYGTSEITTYGIFKMTYGVIFAGMTIGCKRLSFPRRRESSSYYPNLLRTYRIGEVLNKFRQLFKDFYRHSREGGNPALFRIFWIPVFTGMTFGTGTY